jgi:hypothetical protein
MFQGEVMRKFIALVIASAVAIGLVNFAVADESVQTIVGKISPKKLPKKRFKPVKLFVDIKTQVDREHNPNADEPPKANRTVVDFPKNLKFNTDAVKHCNVEAKAGEPDPLDGTTTEQAKELCGGKSIVSIEPTQAHVTVDTNPNGPNSATIPVDVDVTAFNGKKDNTIYLHARAGAPFNITNVLIGKLKDGPTGYGKSLDVTIEPLQAGAIDSFVTTVKAGGYVKGRCNKTTNNWRATTWFSNHPTVTDTFTSKCTRS